MFGQGASINEQEIRNIFRLHDTGAGTQLRDVGALGGG